MYRLVPHSGFNVFIISILCIALLSVHISAMIVAATAAGLIPTNIVLLYAAVKVNTRIPFESISFQVNILIPLFF
jgi:hypothetical protein